MMTKRDAVPRYNEVGFSAFYEKYASRVYRTACLTLQDRHAAEEICQEVFVKAWQNTKMPLDHPGYGRWLNVTTVHACIDRLRREKRLSWQAPEDMERLCDTIEADRSIDDFAAQTVRDAMQSLSDAHRAALVAIYYADLSYRDAAKSLGVPESTIRARLHHAKNHLRRILIETTSPDDLYALAAGQ